MSTKTLPTKERIDNEAERFVAIGAPAPMTTEKLLEANDVRADVGDGEAAVFAVAHQQGIVQRVADNFEKEAMNVLYLTADGERACERWYLGEGPEDFSAVDRAFVVDETELEPIGEGGQRFAPITRRHPEVEG